MSTIFEEDLKSISDEIVKLGIIHKTIFLTGATGLVGSAIAKGILYSNQYGADNRVVALIRNEDKANWIYKEYIGDNHLTLIKGDVNQPFKYNGGVDYIIHTASETKSKNMVTRPVETLWTSVNGTKNVLDFAVEKKAKGVVYLSSMEVYGITDSEKHQIKEDDLGYIDVSNIRSCYPESKRLSENMCACYASEYGLNVISARLAQTFGAGVNKEESRVFAQFAKSAINGEDIVLHTVGKSYGNYVYLADAVRGIFTLLLKGERGQSYTIVNPSTTMQIREMASMVAHDLADDKIKVVFDIPEGNKFGYAPDVTMHLSAEKMEGLGWKPKYGLLDMYKRMIRYWEEQE